MLNYMTTQVPLFVIHVEKHMEMILLSMSMSRGIIWKSFLAPNVIRLNRHNRLNIAEKIFATITNEEQRYFKMMKYVKNQDKCDKTIFNSKKKSSLQIKNNDMY